MEEQKVDQSQIPETPPVEPVQPEAPVVAEEVRKPLIHTYAGDLANALDTTDATVVQQILAEGREREEIEVEQKLRGKQKGWYSTGAIILIVFSLTAIGYTLYHYSGLTVPAQQAVSVGVFPSTAVVVTPTTDIRTVIESLRGDATLEVNKPSLVPLVSDEQSLTLLSNSQLFSFFESKPSEPFLSSFSLLRLGIMNTGVDNVPFVIGATPDVDIATKELLIAEPDMLQLLYKALGIDISTIPQEIGRAFTGEYMYNIPTRTLRYTTVDGVDTPIFFYARVSDTIVVFTTDPSVLKAIYDTLIRQH